MKTGNDNPTNDLNSESARPSVALVAGSPEAAAIVRGSPSAQRLAFSVNETAEMLGVSDKTVRRLIHRKLLHPSRALRHLLIPKKEIERFLDDTSAQ